MKGVSLFHKRYVKIKIMKLLGSVLHVKMVKHVCCVFMICQTSACMYYVHTGSDTSPEDSPLRGSLAKAQTVKSKDKTTCGGCMLINHMKCIKK